jgi:CheY-like chemotaxis protein
MHDAAEKPVALVVDDDPSYRVLMRQLLERAGFTVLAVGDGRTALRALEVQPVAVLVTDLMMPEIEGLELIELVTRGFPGIRIVAVSGDGPTGNEGYLHLARLLGAHAALRKPFSGGVLAAAAMPAAACAAG